MLTEIQYGALKLILQDPVNTKSYHLYVNKRFQCTHSLWNSTSLFLGVIPLA